MGVTTNGYGISFGRDNKILKLDCGDESQFCEYTETHWNVHFKRVNLMVCELYIN